MDSDIRNWCSHQLGFPILKSPDHSLLAASRGLSQLTTSFFAYLRQGIHTHALSSLTIKSTSHIRPAAFSTPGFYPGQGEATSQLLADTTGILPGFPAKVNATFFCAYILCHQQPPVQAELPVFNARQIFNCQRSRLRQQSVERSSSAN